MTNRVQITLYGKQAMVDEDQVKLHLKKEALVREASAQPQPANVVDIVGKIIRLNRRIRPTVQFI